jgi:sialate O-acetylesterase
MLPLLLLAPQAARLPFLSPVFSDHMVLQRDRPNSFWGWAPPGTRVRVSVAQRRAEGVADAEGKWIARLTPPKAGGPYRIVVEGGERVVLEDVLVGDVWLCTGQSNMEMGLTMAANGPAEAAAADEPNLRLAMAPRQIAYAPVATNPLRWQACTPQTVVQGGWGGFSAVGYYFGRELRRKLNVPIGLVQVAWGGTSAEAWTRAESLRPLADFDADLTRLGRRRQAKEPVLGTYLDLWLAERDRGTQERWQDPDLADSAWSTVTPPSPFEVSRGVTWLRREIDLPDPLPPGAPALSLGRINETDTTWINGRLLGVTSFDWAHRRYGIPAGTLRPGRNVIAVRVFHGRGQGGLLSPSEELSLEFGDRRIPVSGAWKAKLGLASDALSSRPRDFEPNPTVPSVLANGMVAPLAPLAIRGAIWYQGETNGGRGLQYRRLLPALIGDWRRMFGQGDFPFYIVSLANFQAHRDQPGDDYWAELREAQAMTAHRMKNGGLAVTVDIGDAGDIHPRDKRTVGERLALNALAKTYRHRVAFSGPIYRSMRREGRAVRLSFDHTEGGLVAKGGRLGEFAVAGADRKWHWADARIEGDTVWVASPDVSAPVAVRYAWQSNPVATLYNGAGLPAVPFRTDDWPALSVGRR